MTDLRKDRRIDSEEALPKMIFFLYIYSHVIFTLGQDRSPGPHCLQVLPPRPRLRPPHGQGARAGVRSHPQCCRPEQVCSILSTHSFSRHKA